MSIDDISTLAPCGCCCVETTPTPELIFNRAGLSAVEYRVGTYAHFLEAMKEAIAGAPELRPYWTARNTSDYGIALLAMWAYVADILTFYQERIANEAFLRTALQPESVTALAALLGYKPSPGVAAEADLVFLLDKLKQVQIPIGLRVQSVPGQNQKPQKFETVQAISADAAFNQLQIFPQPHSYAPFAQNSTGAVLLSATKGLAQGTKLVVFDGTYTELKSIAGLPVANTQQLLNWNPAIQSSALNGSTAGVAPYGRQFRLFGNNAPSSYMQPAVDTTAPGGISWSFITSPYTFSPFIPAGTFALDATYNDIKPGSQFLISAPQASPPVAFLASVKSVASTPATYGPLQDTVSWVSFETWPAQALQPSQVTLYELTQPPLQLYDFMYGPDISGATFFIPISQMASALSLNRSLILDDASVNPTAVNVTACNQIDADGDGVPDHWAVAFTPDLTRTLDTSTAFFYGNVALSTHGETVANEVLGSGDASQTFQSFRPKKNPVTFVHQAGASNGAADTLQLLINGVYWKEVDELYGNTGKDQVFSTSIDSEGMIVQLGDGLTGAQAPTGRSNVLATYRQGIGVVGNVPAGTLKTLLDKPVGLKSVINPVAANGGADPESLNQSRTNAPNTVRTFGRIVSLQDFADQARQYAGIAKAAAVSEWSGEDQVAYLTVAGVDGAEIVDPTFSDLVSDLNMRRDPNRSMRVRSYIQINIQVAAQIDVDPTRVPSDVQVAAQTALINYLSFDNLQFGQPIHLSSIYEVLQAVPGVVAADVLLLQFKSPAVGASHGATAAPVQDQLAIYADELAWIDDSDTDVVVNSGWSPS
jgi:hypothetical protein